MARKYVPASSATPVTDQLLAEGRAKAEAAAQQLLLAEQADPSAPGWEDGYAAASAAVRVTSRRVEALEQLRAAQVERGGKREAAVKAAAPELAAAAARLAASRDAVAAAAAGHLRAAAALAAAAEAHNSLLGESHAKLAELGLRVRDDLLDEGQEHGEGTLDGGGVRAGSVDWTRVEGRALAASAMRQVFDTAPGFRGPFEFTKYWFRRHEVEARPDGLAVPTLAGVGAVAPEPAARVIPRSAPLDDVLPPRKGRKSL